MRVTRLREVPGKLVTCLASCKAYWHRESCEEEGGRHSCCKLRCLSLQACVSEGFWYFGFLQFRDQGKDAPVRRPTWRPRPRPRWRPAPQAALCATCRTRHIAPRTADRRAPACAPAASSSCTTSPSSAQELMCRHTILCSDQGLAGLPSYSACPKAPHGEHAGMPELAGRQARFLLLHASTC